MTTHEYDRARETLLHEIEEKKKDLEALERVYTRKIFPMASQSESDHESNGRHIASSFRPLGKGELLKAVREWVGQQHGHNFTAPQLILGLQAAGFDAKTGSTKSAVANLVEAGFLKTIVRGVGRRASIYKASS